MNNPLRISQVPAFVLDRFDLAVTRQTVYNWVHKGVGNEKLPTVANCPMLAVDVNTLVSFVLRYFEVR